jgi:hypothetical protein
MDNRSRFRYQGGEWSATFGEGTACEWKSRWQGGNAPEAGRKPEVCGTSNREKRRS